MASALARRSAWRSSPTAPAGRTAAEALVDLGVAQVTVSVDGGDAESYARMRGVSVDSALAVVHHLLEPATHAPRHGHRRGGVATRSTAPSLPALLDWASDLKLDFVSIGNLVPHTEEMASEILWLRAGWASVFRTRRGDHGFGPDGSTSRDDPAVVAALAQRGLTYPSPRR